MDNRGRTVAAVFGDYRSVRTSALWQWDKGQILQISGLDLPQAWEAHVANGGSGTTAERYIGSGDSLAIDDKFLESGAPVVVWIYLHETEDDGETEYVVTIPVQRRKRPEDAVPSESQEDAIARAIVALNAAVAATAADVQTAEQAKVDAVSAKDEAEAAKRDAVAAQGAAETAKRDAVTAKDDALQAKRDAVSAKDEAVTARGEAVAAAGTASQGSTAAIQAEAAARAAAAAAGEAQDGAELAARQAAASQTAAAGAAEAASGSAAAASGSAEAAGRAQAAAGQSAQDAAGSATEAGRSKGDAEAAALEAERITFGTENGTPVPATSPYNENNANYLLQLTKDEFNRTKGIADMMDGVALDETAQEFVQLVHDNAVLCSEMFDLMIEQIPGDEAGQMILQDLVDENSYLDLLVRELLEREGAA